MQLVSISSLLKESLKNQIHTPICNVYVHYSVMYERWHHICVSSYLMGFKKKTSLDVTYAEDQYKSRCIIKLREHNANKTNLTCYTTTEISFNCLSRLSTT